ncbi:hypothetical protein Tco_0196364 [Tanacetum coccineum]
MVNNKLSSVSSGFRLQLANPPQEVQSILHCHKPSPSNTESSSHSNSTTTNSDTGYYYKLLATKIFLTFFVVGFDYETKALEEQLLSELRQTINMLCALLHILGIVESISKQIENQEAMTLQSIEEWKKISRNKFKKEVSKITPKNRSCIIDQLESEVPANNSINKSQTNSKQLYKALVDAYEADKILLDTYGDTVTIKRPRDGEDEEPDPTVGTTTGKDYHNKSKSPQAIPHPDSQSAPVEEPMQTTDVFEAPAHQEFETGVHDEQAEEEVQHLPDWFQQPTRLPSPDHAWNKSVPAVHESVQPWLSNLAQRQDPREESARDVYSKRRIIAVTKVEIVEWQNYKHLDWITVRRDDDVLYKFKEGDFHRLRIQDIEDMLLLLVQGKVTNLNVEEHIAFNVSLRMFTRSVVIQRRVEDLQLGVESYQKKLNLTKPDTYRSNLRRQDAYTPYSDPRGFIYENKDKKNRLMRIDELHKFSDGTLDDVRTALNDRLKGIRMEYLPQTFWSQRDKANARAMIQAIDKRLKTRRIMRSLERFVGGRPYGGDLRLLQRTI